MDGILLVNKPIGMTSRDVVNILMKKFNTRKIGHTGTLDPFASGLLIITINKGTKISSFLEDLNKEYIAELKLGESTTTLDLEGEILEKKEVNLPLNQQKVKEVLDSFVGKIKQIPPMYSAIKVDGEELYKKARRGETIERKEREVEINKIELLSITKEKILFKVDCSKGTYIRTLGLDIANKLDYPGHLTHLVRTRVGRFFLKDAKDLEDISEKDIIPISTSLSHLPSIKVNDQDAFKVKNGVKLLLQGADLYFIMDKNSNPLAIYKRKEDGYYYSLRGLF
ncbi:MAG: tRNA pseudouridine(55) synthase TruB [Bacilli bacterium]|nr:tRNA pseudouridine(55) synthase TruB [Bacillales bacterium]MDY2575605.1 tRNA pseudouridine(55) synthase TruB [Bacilli bacterium]